MADSIEGEKCAVIYIDTVVTYELSFMDEPGWMLVMMTHTKHANLTYSNTSSLYVKKIHHDLDIT